MSDSNGSPSLLPAHPKRGPGVRRLNHVPMWIGIGAVCAALGAAGYTYHLRAKSILARETTEAKRGEAGKAAVLDGAPDDGVVLAKLGVAKPPGTVPNPLADQASPNTLASPSDAAHPGEGEDDAMKARRQAWQVYYAQLADIQKQRHDSAVQAMRADTSAGSVGAGGNGAMPQQPAGMAAPMGPVAGQEAIQAPGAGYPAGGYGYPYGGTPYGFGGPPVVPDATGARQKQAFLGQQGSDGSNDTLLATVRDPISPYLITEGDIIPARMQGGADSDTPGGLTGRVASDVCDSATGSYLLIPANSKIVGTYDNVVSAGQDRLPAILTRIIFPDSSSIAIGAMPATDQGGYAGLHDQVDHHYWDKFGNALIVGVAAAGIQLSQPRSRGYNGYDSQQIIAGSLGQQFGQLGQEIARFGLTIPNTLRIRPGYRFGLRLTKDLVLRPYVDGRTHVPPPSNCRPPAGTRPAMQQVHLGPFVQ